MPSRLAFIFVHYRAGALLARAVEAVAADLGAAGLEAELLVVDNGSSAADRRILDRLPARRLETAGNPGYAAGLNLGARSTRAQTLMFLNPDVLVLPGCTAALLAALADGAAAGPRFYWDEDRRFLLPPVERRTPLDELLRRRAVRGEAAARRARWRWRRHARRHWRATEPLVSYDLSGALLAVRREALERVGDFDEGYRLYFEVQDWLLRLADHGLRALHVPAARAVHLYNQSAARHPDARAWFNASETRFVAKHFGRWLPPLFARLGGNVAPRWPPAPPGLPELALPAAGGEALWVEVAASPLGFPAAAERLPPLPGDRWRLPARVYRRLAPGRYRAAAVTESGRELASVVFARPADGGGAPARASAPAMSSAYTIRGYREGDEEAILALFERSFGRRRTLAEWRWEYLDHPHGRLQISVAVDVHGTLGAHYASCPFRFVDAALGRSFVGNQIVDTMTAPEARGVGRGATSLLARATRHHFERFCAGRVGFNYGFNTGKIQRYYLGRIAGSRFLEDVSLRVLERGRLPAAGPGAVELEARRVAALDRRWDELFGRVAADYGLLAERGRRHLEWRYLDAPRRYEFYGVFAGETLAGWSVFSGDGGRLVWGDALYDRRFPTAPRLALAAALAAAGDRQRVEAWFPDRPAWWDASLRALGFRTRREPEGLGMIYLPFEEPDLPVRFRERLYYAKGDSDLF